MIEIQQPYLEIRSGKARLSAQILCGSRFKCLWFEVDAEYAEYIADDRLDAFVVACLFPAMVTGEDIVARGTLSPRLFYHISHNLIPILQIYLGVPRRISVVAEEVKSMGSPPGSGVMTGFSGGIDSFSNYYDHSGDRAPDGWKITHFVYNNVGSHGQSSAEDDEKTFRMRYELLKQFTQEAGIEMIAVNSNMDDIIGLPFERTHTLRNSAVALLLQRRICKFLYASGVSYSQTQVSQKTSTAYLDPVILPMLGTERLECIPSGGQHTRVDKTRFVTEITASRELLDVCVRPDKAPPGRINCSSCWKCLRTAITLAAMGNLQEYDRAFDLEVVRRYERIFILDALSSHDPLQREVAEFIRCTAYPIPGRIRLLQRLLPRFVVRRITTWLWPRMLDRPRLARVAFRVLG